MIVQRICWYTLWWDIWFQFILRMAGSRLHLTTSIIKNLDLMYTDENCISYIYIIYIISILYIICFICVLVHLLKPAVMLCWCYCSRRLCLSLPKTATKVFHYPATFGVRRTWSTFVHWSCVGCQIFTLKLKKVGESTVHIHCMAVYVLRSEHDMIYR